MNAILLFRWEVHCPCPSFVKVENSTFNRKDVSLKEPSAVNPCFIMYPIENAHWSVGARWAVFFFNPLHQLICSPIRSRPMSRKDTP